SSGRRVPREGLRGMPRILRGSAAKHGIVTGCSCRTSRACRPGGSANPRIRTYGTAAVAPGALGLGRRDGGCRNGGVVGPDGAARRAAADYDRAAPGASGGDSGAEALDTGAAPGERKETLSARRRAVTGEDRYGRPGRRHLLDC